MDPSITRNPLVIAGPGVAEGAVCPALVELVDLLPTLLEAAETEAHHTHFGRSLVPLLRDPTQPHRDAVLTEGGFSPIDVDLLERAGGLYGPKARLQHEQPELVGKAIAVRTADHTYVHRQCESDELYDRNGDPAETRNLITDPMHAEVAPALRQRVFDWLVATSDVIPWRKDPRFPEIPHGWR
jgi:arylsulfatase A-like enzyme